MSGFVAACGKPNHREVEHMFHEIRHRGPRLKGVHGTQEVIAAQNYLEADIAQPEQDITIPAAKDALRICYDGQMGNWEALARVHQVSDGSLREERLLLSLYQRYGTDMFAHLNDAIFAFAIIDGDRVLAARDLLGIKTLFYGLKGDNLYLGSELKSIVKVTDEVYEFPPGHYMETGGPFQRFSELPHTPPAKMHEDLEKMIREIREIIEGSLRARVDFRATTGALLSGGIDSSVIAYLASQRYRELFGVESRLPTFALGVGEGQDIYNARVMAEYLNSDHHELVVSPEELVERLPEVIYYLESFDPSLVRSSVSNYLISKYARDQGIEVLLSGEGGDEVFCGYLYLKDCPSSELFDRQMECIGFLHNNASLRLDRMNQCNGVRVVAPLISGDLLTYSLTIPPQYKQMPEGEDKIEKWIFRKAYEEFLPHSIVWRLKQEFSQGSGSAALLGAYFENVIEDRELAEARDRYPMVRSKEELYYLRIFVKRFGEGKALETVGQWVSL